MSKWRLAATSFLCAIIVTLLLINSENEAKVGVPQPHAPSAWWRRGLGERAPKSKDGASVSGAGSETTTPPSSSPNTTTTLERWMREKERGYETDRKRIAKTCEKYGKILKRDASKWSENFMVDAKHGWAYCRHGKVGTSTWMKHFSTVAGLEMGRMTNGKIHEMVPKYFRHKLPAGSSWEKDFFSWKRNKVLTFSFVRHPFERLISAYEDKILNGNDPGYLPKAEKIRSLYGDTSFASFIKFIWEEDLSHCTLASCHVDVHWRPFYERCAYCDVHYDVIGRIESFSDDLKYILEKTGLKGVIEVEERVNGRVQKAVGGRDERVANYFKQLDKGLRRRLYKVYSPDLEMFGYSGKDILDI